MSNRKKGVILSYILMVFEILSTLLLTPFIIRTLGQAEFGVYKLIVSINAYLLLLDLGIGNAIIRYIAKYRVENDLQQSRKFLGIATLFYLAIGVIAIIIGVIIVKVFPLFFAKGLTNEEIVLGQKLFVITMINSAVTLATASYTNAIIAYEKFSLSKGCSIVQVIIRIILTYIVLKQGMGSIGIVTVNLALTIICRGFFVLFVLFKIKLKPLFKGIDRKFIKEISTYSSFIFLQMIASQLNSSVDQVLIGALVKSSAVILAVYGVGIQIVQYFQSIGSAFTGVLMPGIVETVEIHGVGEVITDEMIRVGRLIFMVLAFILGGFLILGRQFIILWAGQVNENAYFVAIILMFAYTFILTESVGTQVLWAINKHKEQSILKLCIVITNIFLTIILIQWNPLFGATIGTFISLVLGDVVIMNVIFVRKIKIDLLKYYLNIFKGIFPSVLVVIIIGYFSSNIITNGWFSIIINALIMTITYVVSMLLFGLNKYEKTLLFSFIAKYFKKTS